MTARVTRPSTIPCVRSRRQHGFTMIELIMVIVMLGVLSVVALPRLVSSSDFSARGFHDSTLAYLRYAQKTAIAQRRTVCVSFPSATLMTLQIAPTAATLACSVNLAGPLGEVSARLQAPGDAVGTALASYTANPTGFSFDGLGRPVNSTTGTALASAQTMQVSTLALTISVEADTGYVHD